ncbi:hypothetical protein FRC00_000586, partial [Tulasnella sp. 408]
MSQAGPSSGERIVRVATALASAAPVPWVSAVVTIIQEIHGLIVRIKQVKPQCKQLAEDAQQIFDELQKHEELHPGDSKIADLVQLLRLRLIGIRTDLKRWAKFNKWLMYFKHEDVLNRIRFHREQLLALINRLTFKGVLIHDVESARLQKTVETIGVDMEEMRLLLEKDSKATEAVRE